MIIRAEGYRVDSGGVSCVFADIFGSEYIGEDDIFVSSSRDELGVVFIDIDGVYIVVVDVFILFDHEGFGGVIQADAAIF